MGRDQPLWDFMDQDTYGQNSGQNVLMDRIHVLVDRLCTMMVMIKAFLKSQQIVWWKDLISNLHTWLEISVLDLTRFVTSTSYSSSFGGC